MALPDGSSAEVPAAKVTEYLLSSTHPTGRTKAAFFNKLGFTSANPGSFVAELKRIAIEGRIADRIEGPFGTKYLVDGEIVGAMGSALIRTIWFVRVVGTKPRLVTAYPLRKKGEGQ